MPDSPPNVVPWNWVAVGMICCPRNSSSVAGAPRATPGASAAASTTASAARRAASFDPTVISDLPREDFLGQQIHREDDPEDDRDDHEHGELHAAQDQPRGACAFPLGRLVRELLDLLLGPVQ